MYSETINNLLAALIYKRFDEDEQSTRAAWSRMMQNYGWDDDPLSRCEFRKMVTRGTKALEDWGL